MTILILSNTANVAYYNMLEECVNSIGNYPVIVVETNSKLKNKKIPLSEKAKFIFPEEEFNYNRFLNIGISHIETENFIISNNDVIYSPGCVQEMSARLSNYDSVSPVDLLNSKQLNVLGPCIEGYDIEVHINGCCIGMSKRTYNAIGKFDESFKFWYQDNDYANLLKHKNLKHALLRDAKIKHLGHKSHSLLGDKHYEMTHGLENIFKEKWIQ